MTNMVGDVAAERYKLDALAKLNSVPSSFSRISKINERDYEVERVKDMSMSQVY